MSSLKYRINSISVVNQANLTKLAKELEERLEALTATFKQMGDKGAGLLIRPYSDCGINTDATVRFEYTRDDVLTQKFLTILGEEHAQVTEQLDKVKAQLSLLGQIVDSAFLTLGRDH